MPRSSTPVRAILCLVLASLAAPITAPGGRVERSMDPQTGQQVTTIHLILHDWIVPDPASQQPENQAIWAVLRAFERRFPEVFAPRVGPRTAAARYRVRLHTFSGIRVEGVESDLLAIAGGVAPDVLYVNFRKSDTYIQQGFLYPLDRPEDGYVSGMTEEEWSFRVHPKIEPVIRRRGPAGERHVWMLPYGGVLGKVLLYRRDLFDQAGVPYPTADWTWADLYQACRTLADPGRGIYAIRFGRGKHEAWYWTTFLWSAGADVLDYDDDANRWRVVFDSPEAAVALDFYTRLCTEPWTDASGRRRYGYAYKDPSQAWVKWQRGEIAMAQGYIDEKLFATINPDVTGMAPVPIGPTGLRGGELNSRMVGLFSGIEDPLVRDAAWAFIRFLDSDEAVRIKTQAMVEGGLGRFVNPKYLRRFGYEELIRLAPRDWEETFQIAIDSGMPEPYGRHSNVAYDILTEPIRQAEQWALAGRLPNSEAARLDRLHGLLQVAADKARRVMLGEVPPAERVRRSWVAAGVLVLVVGAFALALRQVARGFAPVGPEATGGRRRPRSQLLIAALLLAPAGLTILVWQYVPLLRGAAMAFLDYRILGDSRWVGLGHFGDVLFDADWWISVWHALRYSVLVIALTFLPPVILAILLQEVPRFRIAFRTIFYLPAVISGLVVILLWKSFYGESEHGALNGFLMRIPAGVFVAVALGCGGLGGVFARRLMLQDLRGSAAVAAGFGLLLAAACFSIALPILQRPDLPPVARLVATLPEPIRWLSDPGTAMLACVLPLAWAGMGPGCLIYLAALKGIADELYEAADIDGAGFVDKILFIVFPMLRPLLIINFVGVFISAWFFSEANILAMTGGAADTEIAGLRIFYEAFVYLRFGPATAMAWLLGVLLIAFTIYQLRILARVEFVAGGGSGGQ